MNAAAQVMADGPLPQWILEALQGRVELRDWNARPPAAYRQVQGLFTYGHPAVTGELMDALPALRVVSNHGVGVDHIDLAAARDRNVPVGNTPEVLNGAVADLAFALLLATARRLPESRQVAVDPATRHFDQSQLHGQEVHGARLGIVGLGRIGQEIARRAQGFQMAVTYHNRHRDKAAERELAERELAVRYRDLPQLLEESDFVVLSVPLTPQTQGLIGAAELARMKRSAILINVARGAVVKTDDLVAALRAGTIWAAGLDVTDPEPLPRDHPLLTMPNVLITSHIGSATRQTRRQMAQLAVENLLCGLQGRPLVRAVDLRGR
jgi:glyoxylate reductase